MGLPYSRQINAAFEQVTPLVAAGYKILRTTRDISIFLAVLSVVNVLLLLMILLALLGVLVCVCEGMEHERDTLILPTLLFLTHLTPLKILKALLTLCLPLVVAAYLAWRILGVKAWVQDMEYEGNVEATKALEDMEMESDDDVEVDVDVKVEVEEEGGEGEGEEEEEKKGGKGKGKGKGKKK